MPAVEIHRTTPDDRERLRRIRLAALADSPDAFSGTLAEAAALPDAEWRHRATPSTSSACFIAGEGDTWIGMCVVLVRAATELVSVWVDPSHRRRGVVTALLEAAIEWCRHQGHPELLVWVNAANAPAIAAYEKVGFRSTGVSQPFPNRPEQTEMAMRVSVSSHS